VIFPFSRRIRHPFYPSLKPSFARAAKGDQIALYGEMAELLKAARSGVRVRRAVFPIRNRSNPFLTEAERDLLWDAFEAPVYGLLVDSEGDVIGYECEAQDGLHIRDSYASGLLPGTVQHDLCECGRLGPRLMPPADRSANACGIHSEMAGTSR
jgi:hypothetical protein